MERQDTANLPSPWQLDDFDFSAQPSIDQKLARTRSGRLPHRRDQRAVHRTSPGRAVSSWEGPQSTLWRVYYTTA